MSVEQGVLLIGAGLVISLGLVGAIEWWERRKR